MLEHRVVSVKIVGGDVMLELEDGLMLRGLLSCSAVAAADKTGESYTWAASGYIDPILSEKS